MNKAYLISVSTALALGFTAGFASDGLIANAAVPMEQSERITKTLSTGARNSVENIITQQACADVDAKYGANACQTDKNLKTTCFYWQEVTNEEDVTSTVVQMEALFNLGGTFTAAPPQ